MTGSQGYGLCRCGCGEETRRAPYNARREGWVKGEPLRYLPTHHIRRVAGWTATVGPLDSVCWIWTGRRDGDGYARRTVEGQSDLVHVQYWTAEHGAVPPGQELDHLCCDRACVNPDHLEPVTHLENVRRGRRGKLTLDGAREVKALLCAGWGVTDVADAYGVNPGTISHIRTGRAWADA